ncbi:putative E3 ubiquitin-protein ligase RING1a [Impatiens glandulifera]|uniref:putative E3 ubiquitin-protein ligase RING1a n=1 Tax=Impatiens glandulifera TaxID=253017 RepID=UPI001FB0E070|nr:putative E3 ubiquitin-protein ligase RING1a [Impatiens glandulifera]
MPAQKRHSSSEDLHDDDSSPPHQSRRKQSRRERLAEDVRDDEEEEDEEDEEDEEEVKEDLSEGEDSDGSRASDDPTTLPEWVPADLIALRTYVQCPICLGIIKKTRTVMECLHRFCRECIDKSMRLGNNECPACRTHCASRRSLRDDPRFDTLIEVLYQNIEKYEEEELAFHEEEKTRNKQIQDSIAQIFRRQSEALAVKRKTGKDLAASRLPRNYRHSYSRRRRSGRGTELEGSDDNEDENNHDGNKDSSSADELRTETKQRRNRRRAVATHPSSSSAVNSDGGGCAENELETNREIRLSSSTPLRSSEIIGWGGGGARSRSLRSSRSAKLKGYLENSKDNYDKLDVHLMLISLNSKTVPGLAQPFLCCRPSLLVQHLIDYVAQETEMQLEDVEILLVKRADTTGNSLDGDIIDLSVLLGNVSLPSDLFDFCKAMLQPVEGKETLGKLRSNSSIGVNHLILAYRVKNQLK